MRAVASIPAAWYREPGQLARENERVFAPAWQYIGSAAPVEATGTYLAADLAGLPIVITRDAEGVLRGLVNVCRHRGSVIMEGCGQVSTLQCRYHGWSYRLDGALHASRGVEIEPEEGQLPHVAVATIGSLLFASSAGTDEARAAAPTLPELLAPFTALVSDVSGLDMARLERRQSVHHEVAANWKLVAENFMDCYHCPLVHRDTLPEYGGSDYVVEEHGILVTHRLDRDRFSWASLFPNTQISVFGDHGALVARQLSPDGAERTRVTLDYWFDRDTEDVAARAFVEWFERVVAEDLPLCASVQRGIDSNALERGLLHPDQERSVVHFQRLLIDALGEA